MRRMTRRFGVVLLTMALLAGACGGDDDADDTTDTTDDTGDDTADAGDDTAGDDTAGDDMADDGDDAMAVDTSGELAVGLSDYGFDAPDVVASGMTKVTATNNGQELHHTQIMRINDDASFSDVTDALAAQDEAALFGLVTFKGGPAITAPTGSTSVYVDLEPGSYAFICLLPDSEGTPHAALGMLKPFEVTADATSTMTAPATDVEVTAVDYGLQIDGEVSAGVWELTNTGAEPHEINLVQLGEGKTVDDVLAFIGGEAEGPPPGMPVGGVQAIMPGASQQVDFTDLPPGNYAYFCAIPNADGTPHFALGMKGEVQIGG